MPPVWHKHIEWRRREITECQMGSFIWGVSSFDSIDDGYGHTWEMIFMNKFHNIPKIWNPILEVKPNNSSQIN